MVSDSAGSQLTKCSSDQQRSETCLRILLSKSSLPNSLEARAQVNHWLHQGNTADVSIARSSDTTDRETFKHLTCSYSEL